MRDDFNRRRKKCFVILCPDYIEDRKKRGSVVTVDVTAHECKSSTEHGPTTVPVR